jgi:hypothetical protein
VSAGAGVETRARVNVSAVMAGIGYLLGRSKRCPL